MCFTHTYAVLRGVWIWVTKQRGTVLQSGDLDTSAERVL